MRCSFKKTIAIYKPLKKVAKLTCATALSTAFAFAKNQAGTFPGMFPITFFKQQVVASSYIVSIQTFSITIASGSTSNTATISSVNTGRSVIFFGGSEGTDGTNTQRDFGHCTLTDATTVTATRGQGTSSTCTVKGTVVEFTSSAVNVSAQYGTIALGAGVTSNTATISSVNTSFATVFFLGESTTGGAHSTSFPANVELTNSTTVTAARVGSSNTVTVSYCVIEFTSTVIQSIEHKSSTISNTSTTATDTITAVTLANTFINYGSQTSAVSGPNATWSSLALTSTTQITFTREGTTTGNRIHKYDIVEFKPGILNSNQVGTTTLTGATSNTTTITSVNTSKSVLCRNGWRTTVSSTTSIDDIAGDSVLTNATTVTTARAGSGSNYTSGWQVLEFV